MCDIVSKSVRCLNSRVIVAISNSTMPSENTSLRRSSGCPVHCSGDMYATLPLTAPERVSVMRCEALAMPKSTSLTAPS